MLPDTPSRQVQSVKTASKIIDILQNRGGATPTELTNQLDISNSSVHNYLATLEQEGYVVNESGRYRLGLRLLTHGMAAKNVLGSNNLIRNTIQSLADEFPYPIWWVSEEYGRGFFLDGITPDDQTSTYGNVGKRSYLHTHAPGKAILAELTDEYIEQIITRHGLPEQTMRTTTDSETLFEEIQSVRNRGFVVSDGEAVLGILSLGVAFWGPENRVHAIGVFGNSRDFAGTEAEEMGTRLLESVDSLESDLSEVTIDAR